MNNEKDETIYNVPLWEKVMLTIDEAAAYTGVGSRKIRQLTDCLLYTSPSPRD